MESLNKISRVQQMGICNSSESTSSVLTAKLILQDGRLQEFSKPVKVSQILARNPNCFICSSDDMDFDSTLCAIDANDHLQLGELYFVMPLNLLNSPLRTPDMGALAIKASRALKKGDGSGIRNMVLGCGIIKRTDPPLLLNKRVEKTSFVVADGGGTTSGGGRGFREREKGRAARSWGYWKFDVRSLRMLSG